jgi:hypothetical protein
VSTMFLTIRAHLKHSPTDAGAHPVGLAVTVSRNVHIPWQNRRQNVWCFRIPTSDSIRFDQSWNSGVGALAMIRVTTTMTITVIYRNYTKLFDLHRPVARSRTSLTLVAPNRRRPWIHHIQLTPVTLCRNCPLFVFHTNSLIHSLSAAHCRRLSTALTRLSAWRKSQSQSYFTTGSLPPISSSWHQASWGSLQYFFFRLNPCGHSPYVTSSLTRVWFISYEYAWPCQVYTSHI